MLANKTFCLWTKVHRTFSLPISGTREESLSITFLSDFWISGVVPEIFAITIESCQKWRWILDVFSPSQILGGRPSKSYTHFMTPASRHVVWKMFCEYTPTNPEVIVANTLNFKPNFKFSRLFFFLGGGTPVQLRVCAIKAWSITRACKNFRAQHRLRAEIYCLPKKCILMGPNSHWIFCR